MGYIGKDDSKEGKENSKDGSNDSVQPIEVAAYQELATNDQELSAQESPADVGLGGSMHITPPMRVFSF